MSKIEELINKKCPDGVEYKTLEQLEDSGVITLGRGKVISKKDIQDNPGEYPIYSSSAVGSGIFGTYGDYMFDDVRLSWSIDGGGKFFYRDAPRYSVTNVCGWLTVDKPEMMDIRYLYFALTNEWSKKVFDYVHKAHPSVIRKEYTIPVPPLEVQREIVRMLNSFTELEAELEAELVKRKQQYEYYHEKLTSNPKYETVKMEDICTINQGLQIPISQREKEPGENRYFYITVQFLKNSGEKYYINNPPKSVICQKDDILVTRTGSTGIIVYGVEGCFHNNFFKVTPKIALNKRYLYYVLSSNKMYKKMLRVASGGTVPDLPHNKFYKLEIKLPPLDEQNQITDILDKFNTLANDITIGLPAEIEARRKQYEYYRDKLLTFKERVV